MSKILLSVPGHYFIFFKNQPLPFHFSPAQHSIRKGHLKNSGCSHHTCNGRGQASAEPTKVPGFWNYFRILQLVAQVAFAHVAKLDSTSAIRWSWCRSLSSGFAQNQTCTFHLEDWLCYFRSYFLFIQQVYICDGAQSTLTAGPLSVPVVVNSFVSCQISFHFRQVSLIYQMNR